MVELAQVWAKHSTCKRRQVGAVLYHPDTKAVISMGYNDTGIDEIDCGDGGCSACEEGGSTRSRLDCLCCHAEMNTVCLAANRGIATRGYVIATDGGTPPCDSCIKYLRQCGVKEIYHNGETIQITRRTGFGLDSVGRR